ncbi:MAG: hypothetical protein RMZ41_018340 [Nostoc sp. DedVER02]
MSKPFLLFCKSCFNLFSTFSF